MSIGYILALLIAGGVATVMFGRLAQSKGYLASKARRYPILLMIAAISAAVIVYISAALLGAAKPGLAFPVYHVGNWFVISANLLILNKAYRNMKSAPNARS